MAPHNLTEYVQTPKLPFNTFYSLASPTSLALSSLSICFCCFLILKCPSSSSICQIPTKFSRPMSKSFPWSLPHCLELFALNSLGLHVLGFPVHSQASGFSPERPWEKWVEKSPEGWPSPRSWTLGRKMNNSSKYLHSVYYVPDTVLTLYMY